ncbi:putative testis-expressed sequence 2 protein isoform X1 [Apostichopus japonicus]|uniref:Putative testis-expressed sequence 2 protein isoform X1 n=1 Tax=Stichopus japonicus TaxID=307972 RepID=A0A2G8JWP7_STIJA|nr:putative testis-expressed sequence 2 protein isoform X1 [Apostichopus japonicus]
MSSAALDSEEEDSAESSDEEAPRQNFTKATQNKYVKRAFDEVSNTPVELTVEVKELRGTLAINIPPPPTDRLWYGFTKKPHLWLSAKPKLGARQVTLTHVTDYIEKKLDLEFQKVFVLPNMDDVVIPIMLFDVDENRL